MTRSVVDPRNPDLESLRQAADVLRKGGVVAYPTETSYGLAVDPCSDEAVRRLFAVKGRDPAAPVALMKSGLLFRARLTSPGS